jgi:hypothetical protein
VAGRKELLAAAAAALIAGSTLPGSLFADVPSLRVESQVLSEGIGPDVVQVTYNLVNDSRKTITAWSFGCVAANQEGLAENDWFGADVYYVPEEGEREDPGADTSRRPIPPGGRIAEIVTYRLEELDGPYAARSCAPILAIFDDGTFEGSPQLAELTFGERLRDAIWAFGTRRGEAARHNLPRLPQVPAAAAPPGESRVGPPAAPHFGAAKRPPPSTLLRGAPLVGAAVVALDRDFDGQLGGLEVFAEDSAQVPWGEPNVFRALAIFDDLSSGGNFDGKLDPRDSIFAALLLWTDGDRDGKSSDAELRPLSASVAAIDLGRRSLSLAESGDRRVAYLCPGGETFSAVFAGDRRSVTLFAHQVVRRLEAAADGGYFTAGAVFFGDDPDTGAYVAEGETVVLQDCRPRPAQPLSR